MNKDADKVKNAENSEILENAAAIPAPEPISDQQLPESEKERLAALTVLGLDASAKTYAIDYRFWQLTKRYRLEKNPEKLDEVTKAYEIASGRAFAKQAEQTRHQKSRKFFGMSSAQWKVHFHYAWWKYVMLIFVLAMGIVFVQQVFFTKDYDIKVVSLGHITMDNTFMVDSAKEELGYENPYVSFVDLIADDSEPFSPATVNGSTAAASMLAINPDVLIFDARTMPYYFPNISPMDDYYQILLDTLPQTLLDKITPVTMSTEEYDALIAQLDEENQTAATPSPTETPSKTGTQLVYGLQVSDPDLIRALGYENLWSKDPPTLVFSICIYSKNTNDAEKFITWILRNQNIIVSDFLEKEASESS